MASATLLATWFGAGTLLTSTDEMAAEGFRVVALEPLGSGLCLMVTRLFCTPAMGYEGMCLGGLL